MTSIYRHDFINQSSESHDFVTHLPSVSHVPTMVQSDRSVFVGRLCAMPNRRIAAKIKLRNGVVAQLNRSHDSPHLSNHISVYFIANIYCILYCLQSAFLLKRPFTHIVSVSDI